MDDKDGMQRMHDNTCAERFQDGQPACVSEVHEIDESFEMLAYHSHWTPNDMIMRLHLL